MRELGRLLAHHTIACFPKNGSGARGSYARK